MNKTAFISDRVVTPEGVVKGVVLMDKGIHITTEIPAAGYDIIDLGNKVIMPGIIDPHVHINEPGRTEWEGFDTATKAAIAGGITTLVDMPLNSSPVTTTAKAFDKKLEAAKDKLHADVGFWGGIIPGNEKEIEPLIKKGVLGFKAFLTHSGIDEFPNVTEEDLRKAMPIIAKHDLPLLVHCELSTPTSHLPLATRSHQEYLASRPKSWEDNATALMIRLCEEFNCRTHIVHLSSADSIKQIAKAKEKGLPLTVETAQHYLYFNAEDIKDGQTPFKCAPPIRERSNNKKLWQALKDGIIDFVATDHSPAPPEMKDLQGGDFMKAWGGISSIQFALPVLWTAARKHDCTISDIAKWLCYNPAKLLRISNTEQARPDDRVGRGISNSEGVVIWDPEQSFVVKEENIHHKHKITPYLGEELYGVVEQTWIRGEKVFDKGEFIKLNKGRCIVAGGS